MPKIVWLSEALQDMHRLFLFLYEKNIDAAISSATVIEEKSEILLKFPEAGRPLNDKTGRRELIIPFGKGCYVLRYMLNKKTVVIIRVWHSKENKMLDEIASQQFVRKNKDD